MISKVCLEACTWSPCGLREHPLAVYMCPLSPTVQCWDEGLLAGGRKLGRRSRERVTEGSLGCRGQIGCPLLRDTLPHSISVQGQTLLSQPRSWALGEEKGTKLMQALPSGPGGGE